MADLVTVLTAGTAGTAAILGGLATWRQARTATDATQAGATQALLDDYRDALAAERGQVTSLGRRVDALERRERLLVDHVLALRRHIAEQLPPPPPDWPQSLTQETT